MKPSPRPAVQKLAPYVPGRPIEEVEAQYGITGAVKLASNENPLGPSPKALAAALEATASVHLYPDGSGTFLRRALAARHRFPEDQVILGCGSCELIDIVIRAYVDPGDEVVVPAGIFRMFPVAVGRAGGAFVEVPTSQHYARQGRFLYEHSERFYRAFDGRVRVSIGTDTHHSLGEVGNIGRGMEFLLSNGLCRQLLFNGER